MEDEGMSVTIRDVAVRSGVSIATVSRVVNHTGYPVSQELQEKILNSIKELNYIPNRSARALKTNKGRGIALIVRKISDPYYCGIADGVTETAIKHDVVASVFNSLQDTTLEMRFFQMILEQQYDGVIIGGSGYSNKESISREEKTVNMLRQQGCKAVALGPQGFPIAVVSVDNLDVGMKGAEYLYNHGHRKIAFFGGYKNHLADGLRLQGFQEALASHDLETTETLVFNSDYSRRGGYESCQNLLKSGQKCTAIFCSNDHIARGAIRCLRDAGFQIPEDFSVMGTCGFYRNDDFVLGTPLTTIAFPFYDMGRCAVEYILGDKNDTYRKILPTEIIEDSTVKFL